VTDRQTDILTTAKTVLHNALYGKMCQIIWLLQRTLLPQSASSFEHCCLTMDIGRQKCSTNRKDFPKRHSTDPNSPTWYGKQAEKEGCNESTLSQCFSFLSFFLATYDQDRSAAVYCYCSSVTMQAEQEAWPPSSANTVCPRRPLMTQVQYWAKTAQTDHVTLRPWPLILKVMAPVADAGRRPRSVYQVWSS